MKKLLTTIACIAFLFTGLTFTQAGTMNEAFSLKGDPTVGIGRVPWQHRLMYGIYEKELKEIRNYIIRNGQHYSGQDYVTSLYHDSTSNLLFAIALVWGVEYLIIQAPGNTCNSLFYLTYLSHESEFGTEWTWNCQVDIVKKLDKTAHRRVGTILIEGWKIAPSIYSSIFLKYLRRFYNAHLIDWNKDTISAR